MPTVYHSEVHDMDFPAKSSRRKVSRVSTESERTEDMYFGVSVSGSDMSCQVRVRRERPSTPLIVARKRWSLVSVVSENWGIVTYVVVLCVSSCGGSVRSVCKYSKSAQDTRHGGKQDLENRLPQVVHTCLLILLLSLILTCVELILTSR